MGPLAPRTGAGRARWGAPRAPARAALPGLRARPGRGPEAQRTGARERRLRADMSDPDVHTTTKKELVNRIAGRTGQTKVVVKEILQRFLDEIIHELTLGNRIEFREFGVFEVKERRARRAQ